MKATVRDRLQHILDAIDRIETIAARRTVSDLNNDLMMQPAILQLLGVISEASRHVPNELKADAPHIPWRQIADLGNVLRHMYDGINADAIWIIVQRDLAPLKATVAQFLPQDSGNK